MERNSLKKQIKLRLVVYPAIALIIYGALAFFLSPNARSITMRQDKAINIIVLTGQPVFISYNPKYKKAIVTNIETSKKNITIQDILSQAGLSANDILFIDPALNNRSKFWEAFKANLHYWQQKPYLIFSYIYDYIRLRAKDKTNISTADFITLTMDLMTMSPADFSLKTPEAPKQPEGRRRAKTPPPPPGSQIAIAKDITVSENTQQPLVLEILNASGSGGLAAEVTRYLRELNNNGSLNLDVINYANYPVKEAKTKIIDHNGRLADLKKVSLFLGLENKEIFSRQDKTAISDAKIILGSDFVLPKSTK